jgi:hypothetical protein
MTKKDLSEEELEQLLDAMLEKPWELDQLPSAILTLGVHDEHIQEWREVLGDLGTALPDQKPPDRLRSHLLSALDSPSISKGYTARLATLFDITESDVEKVLARMQHAEEWVPFLPQVSLLHLAGGPAIQGADAGLVRFEAGMTYPSHIHQGEERQLILCGSLIDNLGHRFAEGDLIVMAKDSEHELIVTSDVPCVCAVVLFNGLTWSDGQAVDIPHLSFYF